MRDHLNANWSTRPVDVDIEDFLKAPPALMLQQNAAAEVKRMYINGGYIGSWVFSVYARVKASDTATRLKAIGTLDELSRWFTARDEQQAYINLPQLGSHRKAVKVSLQTTPAIAYRDEDGTEDYQAVFELEYKYSPLT
jgi:hypothetical protein